MSKRAIDVKNLHLQRSPFDIPVDYIRGALRPKGVFKPAKGLHTIRVSLETIIQYASRYLYVDPTVVRVSRHVSRDWKNILRWELATYWDIDVTNRSIETKHKANGSFSHEHAQRSGEYLACGFALLVIDKALRVAPSHVKFFAATGSRPDFYVPFLLPSGMSAGLEARCRGYFTNPGSKEKAGILAKKAVGQTLVVYFHHGRGFTITHAKRRNSKTRLFLVDPEGSGSAESNDELSETAIRNYYYLTERIGLHRYSAMLRAALTMRLETGHFPDRDDSLAPDFTVRDVRHPLRRRFLGRLYVGREFSSVLTESSSTDDARMRVRAGDYGTYSFEGLDCRVLSMIARNSFDELSAFRAHTVDAFGKAGVTVFGDGFLTRDIDISDPQSPEAISIRQSLE